MQTDRNEEKPTSTDTVYRKSRWKTNVITWVMRLLVGGTFIFSGFVKAIDPWGTIYKFDDYLAAMSLDIWPNLVLVGAFALCAAEFLCGVFLLLGCFRRSVAILAAVIMAVMLPLTLWIAMYSPVADCGCFGDAYVISNWATFWKNVAISVCVIWLIIYNKKCHWLITPALQWLAFVASGLFIVVVELFGYVSQPLLDFRPYKVGVPITDTGLSNSREPKYEFIYEKDGERKSFSIDDELPSEDQGWTFLERKELPVDNDSSEQDNSDRNLRIWSKDGEEDVTEEALTTDGKELLVMMPDLNRVSPATTWKLNSLYEWSVKNDVEMVAVVSGSPEEIDVWEDLSMASYPIYTADDTQIKSVVRGNPGVVYLVDGFVEWKSTLTAINIDDFLSPDISHDAANFGLDNVRILRNLSYIYLTVMAVLIILSFLPYVQKMYPSRKKPNRSSREDNLTHDDKAHYEE